MKQLLFALVFLAAALTFALRAREPSVAIQSLARALPEAEEMERTVVISMLYSPEKQAWVEWARDRYVRENPLVQVKLTPLGSLESIDALLLGQEKPVVWSPESRLELGEAAVRFREQTGRPLYSADAASAPQSLLETVLVLVAWESRAQVLDDYLRKHGAEDPRVWKRLIDAAASPSGWRALEGPAQWGSVKLGYTDPLQTSSGLWTVYLACVDALGGADLSPEQLDDPAVLELLRAAVVPQNPPLTSDSELLERMEQFGPSRYDMVVADENLALGALDIPPQRWEPLVLLYPPRLASNDHPAVVLDLDGTSPEQKAAGRDWIRFLRSRAVQLEATRYGFRPVDASVPLSENRDQNPFILHHRQVDEQLDATQRVAPPRGDVMEQLELRLRNQAIQSGAGNTEFFVLHH